MSEIVSINRELAARFLRDVADKIESGDRELTAFNIQDYPAIKKTSVSLEFKG